MTGVQSGALVMCACWLPVHATSTTNWAFLSLSLPSIASLLTALPDVCNHL